MEMRLPDWQREQVIHIEGVMNFNLFILSGLFVLGCSSADSVVPVTPTMSVPTEPTALTGGELLTPVAFQEWAGPQYMVVDVRKTDEPGKHIIAGALPVFLERLGPMYPGLIDHDKSVPVLIVADNDEEALRASQMLTIAGYRAAGLKGGIKSWVSAGFPTKIKLAE